MANILAIGSRLVSFLLQYPIERHIKPDYTKSDKLRQDLLTIIPPSPPRVVASPQPKPTEALIEPTLEETIAREREGDYCIACVPSKHLMRAKDALTDALNITNSKGEFTQVAEDKLQVAVYELNGAEVDLEKARIPELVKPATDELHNQIRKLRNFLRQDQSGLEIATAIPQEHFEEAKKSLETAHQVSDALIGFGYDITKVHVRARQEEMEKEAV